MLDRFLRPHSVALFGATPDDSKLRGRITRIINENGYQGRIHYINPSRPDINGKKCYDSILDVGEEIDLAIIVVPAEKVVATLEECARAGVAFSLIMSSGFAEAGPETSQMQDAITRIARESGMRVCGPNSEGFHNEIASLSATFSPAVELNDADLFVASRSRIGVIAQSGGIGFSLYHRGRNMGLSFSSVITTGNEADLTVADFLDVLVDDADTSAVLLFLETVRDGSRFTQALARAWSKGKPVVAIKVGRSQAGSRATISHTGAMSGWDAAYDAVFQRYGVIVADDLGRALAILAGLVTNPSAVGRRAAVVTVSGGAGALVADMLTSAGFELPELSTGIQDEIRTLIPSYGSTGNPIDVTGQATRTGAPLRVLEILSEDEGVDLIVFACTMSNRTRPPVEVEGLARLITARAKPIFFFSYTLASPFGLRALAAAGTVAYHDLFELVEAANSVCQRVELQSRLDLQAQAKPIPLSIPSGVGCMTEHAAKDLLQEYGINLPPRVVLRSDNDVELVEDGFFPVAAKVQSVDLPHKHEAGGVVLGIADRKSLLEARQRILKAAARFNPAASIDGILVEPMARPGREMLIGIVRDETFGPIISVALGGIEAEVHRDVVRMLAPVSVENALHMIGSLKSFALLREFRGEQARDINCLARLVSQISCMAAEYRDCISEIEINPVIVHADGEGCTIVDALINKGTIVAAA